MTHYGFDDRLDEYLRYIWGFIVQWCLIGWHWTTETWNRGYEWVLTTLRAIEDAHKENVWVFMDRNSMPLLVKNDNLTENYNNCLLFYPDTNTFLLHNRLMENGLQSFDCVDVTLGTENVTGFFMNLRWKQGAAPTLVECILLYGILTRLPMSKQTITTKSLTVLDSNTDEHQILLGSEQAKRRFTSWT